ncbi:MAG: hypothetical protein C5B56_05035 [Proteobacteria bacterium]|nr:MAG: hypothetical protein C5B56_05035 [Pseudomonadota bacterium]
MIEMNVRWLRQALGVLERLDDRTYTLTPEGFAPHRAGAHLRHVLEFYQCFLEGQGSSHIDYDARRRNEAMERSREAASSVIRSIIRALQTERELRQERIVWVRMEDAESSGTHEPFMESSVSRELQVLSSHTVHHFALIAMTLRAHGVHVDPEFGMAPSTLRHLAARAEAA